MDLTRREYSMHGHNSLLKDFIHHNETRLKKLQDDARISQVEKIEAFELSELFWTNLDKAETFWSLYCICRDENQMVIDFQIVRNSYEWSLWAIILD